MANFAMNTFSQSVAKGQMDLRYNPGNFSAMIDVSSTLGADGGVGLVPGQPVKLVDSAGGIPKVIECAADSDDVYGFIIYDVKSSKFMRGDRCEISGMRSGVMYMEASAAIARGAEVAILLAGVKVVTAASGDRIVGRAFDKATAAGQMIRVTIDLPGDLKA